MRTVIVKRVVFGSVNCNLSSIIYCYFCVRLYSDFYFYLQVISSFFTIGWYCLLFVWQQFGKKKELFFEVMGVLCCWCQISINYIKQSVVMLLVCVYVCLQKFSPFIVDSLNFGQIFFNVTRRSLWVLKHLSIIYHVI